MRHWIVFLALLTGCAAGSASAPPRTATTPRAVGVVVTTNVAGTVVELTVSRVMACSETDSSECERVPLANQDLSIAERGSGAQLATLRTGSDGVARVDLAEAEEKFVRLGDEYDVLLGDRPKGRLALREARALVVAAKNARDVEHYFAEARTAADRKDWRAAERAAGSCVRLMVNHIECAHLAEQAGAALRTEEASAKQAIADAQLALASDALRDQRWQDAFDAATTCMIADPQRTKCNDILAKTKGHAQPARALAQQRQPTSPEQVESDPDRQRAVRTAREHGYERVIFDVGITGAVNLMVVGRNKLADFRGAVVAAHQADSALRPLQVLGRDRALFTSSLAELPVLVVDFPREIFEYSEFNLLQTNYWLIKGVTEYQGLRGRRQAVVVTPAW